MRVLVTGADGLLGSNLVRLLLEQKHEVSVYVYPSSQSRTLEDLNVDRYSGDIVDMALLEEAVLGNEIIVHAAASTSLWPKRSDRVRAINIKGTQNVIDLSIKHNIKRLVFVGSGAVMPTNGLYKYVGEKYGLDYIDSKYEAFNLVNQAVEERGLRAISIMPTFMIGPYDSLPSSGKMIQSQAKGSIMFCSSGGRNFVNVADVAHAIIRAFELGENGKAYLIGNENLSYMKFLIKVSKITGKKKPLLTFPAPIIKGIGMFGSLIGLLTGRPPFMSYTMGRIACDNQFSNDEEAVRELNLAPTTIEEAIENCYRWFRDNDYC